jgi:hypothetical protein
VRSLLLLPGHTDLIGGWYGTNESSAPAHVDRDTELERVAGGATGFPAGLKSPICTFRPDPAALTATCIRRGFHHRPDGASRNAP